MTDSSKKKKNASEPDKAKKPASAAKTVNETPARKNVEKKPVGAKTTANKTASPTPKSKATTPKIPNKDLEALKRHLLEERARLIDTVEELRKESLIRHDEVNHEEDGTDAFIRISGLDRASSEQQQVRKIDEALAAIEAGNYGKCEICGGPIGTARLKALPSAKNCIKCQAAAETDYRAFSPGRR